MPPNLLGAPFFACSLSPCLLRAARLYGGDVSLLVDVARTSIVFAEIQDLRRCLGEIAIDKDVYVERVKNRLSDSCASDETAGYRCTPARRPGLGKQVCWRAGA